MIADKHREQNSSIYGGPNHEETTRKDEDPTCQFASMEANNETQRSSEMTEGAIMVSDDQS